MISKEELLIICHTLYQSLESHLFTLPSATINTLKEKISEIVEWAESVEEGDFRAKIFEINEICNEVYSNNTTTKVEEEPIPDVKIEIAPPKTKIHEDIDSLINAIDMADDLDVESDSDNSDEDSGDLHQMLDELKMYGEKDVQVNRNR